MKAFIIEDDINFANSLAEKLGKLSFQIEIFDSSEKAEDALSNEIPDLITLDIGLPGKSGLELLKSIRENPRTENIYVIIITCMESQILRIIAKELGVTSFLLKPSLSTCLDLEKTIKYLYGLRDEQTS
jgi:DNA-binding response OmpR family regulator